MSANRRINDERDLRRRKLCDAYEARHKAYEYRSAPADKRGYHSMSTSQWAAYQTWVRAFRREVMDIQWYGHLT